MLCVALTTQVLKEQCTPNVVAFSSQMTSVERVMEYSNLEQEAELHRDDELPEDWPAYGAISAKRLCYSHHPDLPTVLQNINFSIKSNEKVPQWK